MATCPVVLLYKMKIHHSIPVKNSITNPVITIGTFDGVHFGHKKILSYLKKKASDCNGKSVVISFDPHPRKVLFPYDDGMKLLTTVEEKIDLFSSEGIDHLIIIPFTKDFSRTTAVEFVRDILVLQIGMKNLVIGYDHHFGRNREGSIENLKEMAKMYDFEVKEIPAELVNESAVSSTKIRRALSEGNILLANKYLGYNYNFSGLVVEGNLQGTKLGFPTANIKLKSDEKMIPKIGVYAVKVKKNGSEFIGVMNIGVRPTITDGKHVVIEVHLLGFSGNLYGEILLVEVLNYIRSEKKFNSVNELVEQINRDINVTKQSFQLLNRI